VKQSSVVALEAPKTDDGSNYSEDVEQVAEATAPMETSKPEEESIVEE
jgi:hypothetical protein